MRKMAAGWFQAHCLAVMDEVQAKREAVVITKQGRPVAKLVPASRDTDEIYNFRKGKGTVTGDIVSPAILPITGRTCVLALGLPAAYPSDPADRIIGATALAE